jgi:hypothetical protein
MRPDQKISVALRRLGDPDGLDWSRRYATRPLVELNTMLAAGVAPVHLQSFIADRARASGRYDEFLRIEAVRLLNEYFPEGFSKSDNQQYGLASSWVMWSGIVEPSHEELARDVWNLVTKTLRENSEWCPQRPDDELLLAAFAGRSFAPTEGSKRLAAALRRMEQEAALGNLPYSDHRAVANLQCLPAGYGWLYGLYSVDGQVCNGGFEQYYDNTGGAAACLAMAGYRMIGRQDFAAIVAESLAHAQTLPEFRARLPNCEGIPLKSLPARPFEELDEAYYTLKRAEKSNWLEAAIIDLVLAHTEAF